MDQLPTPTTITPFFSYRIALDGVDYYLGFEWNERSGWYLGINDSSDTPIMSPRKMVVNYNLIRNLTDPRRPPGVLRLIDISGRNQEAGYDDLGNRCVLIYLPILEVQVL